MKTAKSLKSSGIAKFWKAPFETNEYSRSSDDESSETESPRNNIIDSFNLYSALDKQHQNKLENTAAYLPPINEIAKKYKSVKLLTQMPSSKQRNQDTIFDLPDSSDLKKFTRFHITDANLVREKSAIEKSAFYSLNKKLEKRKTQACAKKRLTIADTANFNNRKQILEAVSNSLPDVKTVYKNESGLESRMNSFYHENLKRLNKHPVPFCEYAKEHANHEKDKRKAVHINCVFCADQIEGKVGTVAPENSFIEDHHSKPKTPKTPKIPRKLPILKFNQNIQQYQLLNNNNQNYNQAMTSLNPPEKSKKTFFCDVLGEKYCLGCIECHERRFAKVFESKYMNESDPLLVTMNLLINQRTVKPLS